MQTAKQQAMQRSIYTRLLSRSSLSVIGACMAATYTTKLALDPVKVECSPYFNGCPVAASLLMRQASTIFDKEFPGLEMSAVFLSPELIAYQAKVERQRKEERNMVGAVPANIPGEDIERNSRTREITLSLFAYDEHGLFKWLNWPSAASCSVPVMPRFSEQEEQELGRNGVYKSPVGRLHISGKCKYGCAQVFIDKLRLEKLNGELVWEWSA